MSDYKFKIVSFLVAWAILIVTTSSQCKTQTEVHTQPMHEEGFAVLELFTSQGCSSCPPADNLLGKYATQNNDKLITLAFHVDYWNRLGWTDSFSTATFSDRQRDYANRIDHSSVYTPQLIVNGTKEFVGSDDIKIAAAVANAFKENPAVSITIDKTGRKGNTISIDYKLDKIAAHTSLQAALVQKQVFTNILKGENSGLKITHYNVVRGFISTHVKSKTAIAEMTLPKGYSEKDFSIVLFVQEDASGKIIGATKRDL